MTENLKDLISTGIIERFEFDEKVLHTEYKLTPLGESMQPIMAALADWGNTYKKQRV